MTRMKQICTDLFILGPVVISDIGKNQYSIFSDFNMGNIYLNTDDTD